MIRRQFAALLLLFTLVVPYAAFAQQPPEDPMIAKIKDEGLNRSQVMQTLSYLTDVIGPRLTASPGMKRSNEWTRDTLTKWGLQNAHLESWGPFGRGWSLKRFSAQVVSPQDIPLIAYPKAWSPSVKVVPEIPAMPATSRRNAKLSIAPPPVSNTVTADVVFLDARNEADLDKFKGQLKGKIVLLSQPVEVKAMFDAPGRRQDEKSLLALANALPPGQGGGFGGGGGGGAGRGPNGQQMTAAERQQQLFQQTVFNAKRWNMLVDEGAAVVVDVSPRGSGGTIFVQSATAAPPIPKSLEEMRPGVLPRVSVYDPKSEAKIVPQITVAAEHYNRLIRMIQQGEKLKMTVDLAVEYQDTDNNGYNTIAEIPGTDLKDEIVMLGGHMDSWHSATGATDNGAGVAVAMEAVRILQTLGIKPRRTIRIGLWTGEEQGLLGSQAYVKAHFGVLEGGPQFGGGGGGNANATPAKLTTMPEYEKFSGYFNLDNGTGRIRGIYLQGNDAVRPIFRQWLSAFRDIPNQYQWNAQTITISNTGGTDHQSFDRIGLPGFQFIQDEIEYDTRTHHSNQDLFDRIQADDMKQAATIMAAFVYNTAMRDEKLPRKPAPGTRATSTTSNQ
jgi:hypothetical protein